MGNHKFKLSDMMPNAWFYKLRDMSNKPKNQNTQNKKLSTPPKNPRKSYYHPTNSRLLIHNNYSISPTNPKSPNQHSRKSSKKRAKRKTIYMPSPSNDTIFQDDQNTPVSTKPGNFHSFDYELDSFDDGLSSSCAADIIIEVDRISYGSRFELDDELDLNLPPIATKPAGTKKIKTGARARKSVSRPGGVKVKIRANPKTATTKSVSRPEKLMGLFYSDSMAIVKASIDPERDFRESMMEMIVENNIRGSKELEDLLACYLSLNDYHYHGLIIKAFEQIWFNMPSEPCF
ncbi:hypothetical protein CASFOL_005609 [Castilleja foliolosa]|uniref:Transcription repressor n=1 Tax=Castilleja foliolosa TaxID=1961234 RepID=A0ABD3E3Z6_9LAMI